MSLHGGNIREAIEQFRPKAGLITDFSASINPLGIPESIKKIILKNLDIIMHYPDLDCKHIKNSLSKYLNISEDNLLVGNGSIELIFLITLALRPKKILIPVPTFSEYEKAAKLTGAQPVFLKMHENNNFQIKEGEILRHLESVDLVFLCNPNNPTGFLFKKDTIRSIARECEKKGVYLVVDEVFMDFVKEKNSPTLLKTAPRTKKLLVLRSLTKFFALAGLRLGYMVGNKRLIEKISRFQPPWSVNTLAQLSGSYILSNTQYIKKSLVYMFKERDFLFKELDKIDFLKPYPPTANFIFCKLVNSKINSKKVSEYCGKRGILIRDCSNFRGLDDAFIRVAVRKRQDNNKLINILKEIVL